MIRMWHVAAAAAVLIHASVGRAQVTDPLVIPAVALGQPAVTPPEVSVRPAVATQADVGSPVQPAVAHPSQARVPVTRVGYQESQAPIEVAPAPRVSEPAPVAAPYSPSQVYAAPAPGHVTGRRKLDMHRLAGWLFYVPLKPPKECKCWGCAPSCTPPLYTYFLWLHGTSPGCQHDGGHYDH